MRPIQHSRTAALTVSVVAALVATLTGCGSGNSNSTSGSTNTIHYIDVGDILASYPRLQAEAAGYFAEEGVKLDLKSNIANANQIVQSVANGQADMALTGGTGPLAVANTSRSVKVVAVLGAPAPLQVALNNKTLADLADKGITPESPYKDKVTALKSLKLATFPTGSTTDLLFREAVSDAGFEPDKLLTIQPFSDPAALTAAARQGASNGLIAFPNQSTTPEADGWGKVFIDFLSEARESVDLPYIVAIANPKFLDKNPELVKKFVAAMVKSRDDAKNMTDEKAAALKKASFPDLSDAAFKAGLDAILPAFSTSLVPTEKQAQSLLKVFNKTQEKPLVLDFQDIFDVSVVKGVPGA